MKMKITSNKTGKQIKIEGNKQKGEERNEGQIKVSVSTQSCADKINGHVLKQIHTPYASHQYISLKAILPYFLSYS